jgi:hypothetical protein
MTKAQTNSFTFDIEERVSNIKLFNSPYIMVDYPVVLLFTTFFLLNCPVYLISILIRWRKGTSVTKKKEKTK